MALIRYLQSWYQPNPRPLPWMSSVAGIAVLTFILVFYDTLTSPEMSVEISWWRPFYLWAAVAIGALALLRGVIDEVIHIHRESGERA